MPASPKNGQFSAVPVLCAISACHHHSLQTLPPLQTPFILTTVTPSLLDVLCHCVLYPDPSVSRTSNDSEPRECSIYVCSTVHLAINTTHTLANYQVPNLCFHPRPSPKTPLVCPSPLRDLMGNLSCPSQTDLTRPTCFPFWRLPSFVGRGQLPGLCEFSIPLWSVSSSPGNTLYAKHICLCVYCPLPLEHKYQEIRDFILFAAVFTIPETIPDNNRCSINTYTFLVFCLMNFSKGTEIR